MTYRVTQKSTQDGVAIVSLRRTDGKPLSDAERACYMRALRSAIGYWAGDLTKARSTRTPEHSAICSSGVTMEESQAIISAVSELGA